MGFLLVILKVDMALRLVDEFCAMEQILIFWYLSLMLQKNISKPILNKFLVDGKITCVTSGGKGK